MADNLGVRLFHTRWLVRLPIGLFRARLGFLFGSRLMLLEHRGRKSGDPRFVVLEVLTMPSRDELVLASGTGRQAQWFKNVEANPHCHVSIGFRRRVEAVATVLAPSQAEPVIAQYQAAHPALWNKLNALMQELQGGSDNFEIPLVRVHMAGRTSNQGVGDPP